MHAVITHPAALMTQPHRARAVHLQVTHSATQEQLEVISSLQPMFEQHILPLLTPVEQMWQPTDFLPDSRDQDQFFEEVGGWLASGAGPGLDQWDGQAGAAQPEGLGGRV